MPFLSGLIEGFTSMLMRLLRRRIQNVDGSIPKKILFSIYRLIVLRNSLKKGKLKYSVTLLIVGLKSLLSGCIFSLKGTEYKATVSFHKDVTAYGFNAYYIVEASETNPSPEEFISAILKAGLSCITWELYLVSNPSVRTSTWMPASLIKVKEEAQNHE